jgi:hypothetical protein
MGFHSREDVRPDFHVRIPLTARMITSGVAGASKGGILPGFRHDIALKIADQTEIASIKGGSPTALER